MPGPVARWRAMRLLTRTLAGEDIEASSTEWSHAVALARDHSLLGGLATVVKGRSVPLNESDRKDLDWLYKSTIARALRMRSEARDMVSVLNDAGIEPLLMKGALLLLRRLLPDPGIRVAADLDVVVPPERWADAVAALEGAGYRPAPGPPFLHPHELPFLHPDRLAPIELHRTLGGRAIDAVIPVAGAWSRAQFVTDDGVRFWSLGVTDQFVHNIAHTQLQDLNYSVLGVPLRQLHTFVLLTRIHAPELPWAAVEEQFRRCGELGAHDFHLALVRSLFGPSVAAPVPSGARRVRSAARADLACALATVGPVSDGVRNFRYAVGADYLDSLYHHGGRRAALAAARVKHLWRTGRGLGREGIADSLRRPVR